MPGRQSHGRPLIAEKTSRKAGKKSIKKSRAHALDAFAIASHQVDETSTSRRDTYLDPESDRPQKRHRRDGDEDEDGDGDDEEAEDGAARLKKRRRQDEDDKDRGGEDYGSDSEGNEWHVGVEEDDEDSDIDSDEAFGESDDERFDGFTFRGSQKKTKNEAESDSEEDGESLGEDAIDLAQALDDVSEDEEEEAGGSDDGESGSEEDDDADSESASETDGEDDDDEPDITKIAALQNLISGFGGKQGREEEDDQTVMPKMTKISLEDLGLSGVKDSNIRKSLKLMGSDKTAKPGAGKKLVVPLARRQQDRLDRAAAYEKTNETLERWQDTVQFNRRAEHLIFPLPESLPNAGLEQPEIGKLDHKAPGSELERTILSIMEESGIGPTAEKERKEAEKEEQKEEDPSQPDRRALIRERRRQREVESREQARAKRIKKIKSKAYRRIHRRERMNDEAATHEAMVEAGEIDSEEEREAQDRRRAMERMGSRHRESKWAKTSSKVGRAVWDDDFRTGLNDMTRKDEELRRRIEGRGNGSEEEEDSDDSHESEEDGDQRLLRQLDEAESLEDEPQSKLLQMKFMRRAEEAQKKANDELVAQIRRDLDPDSASAEDQDDEPVEIGRRKFGGAKSTKFPGDGGENALNSAGESKAAGSLSQHPSSKKALTPAIQTAVTAASSRDPTVGAPGAWSSGAARSDRRKSKKQSGSGRTEELDLSSAVMVATNKAKPSKKSKSKSKVKPGADQEEAEDATRGTDSGSNSEDEDGLHLPMAIRDQELVKRAFAGEDVVGEFEQEKEAMVEEQDEKVVDKALPGWGSWVGDGISKREQKRNRGKVLAKVDGVKRRDRKDAKLEKVIINEKRLKRSDKYLASQLPHVFETRAQYERSLRLPLGPEWMTKRSFQDGTKPRVIVKQGIIAPISRPMLNQ